MGWFRVLIETWWWVLLGALVGIVVGYFLGRLLKPDDVLAHPHFTALKAEFDDQHATARTQADRIAELEKDAARLRAGAAATRAELDACRAERDALVAGPEPVATRSFVAADMASPPAEVEAPAKVGSPPAPAEVAASPAGAEVGSSFDASSAAAAYGSRVALDDLKIVEGIGPKIEELLHGANVHTWRDLAGTPVDTLREVLRGGGDRFRMHDPSSWPEQSAMAADGRFADLRALQDRLTAGRS